MYRSKIWATGIAILTAGLLAFTASPILAAPHGGGHGGGHSGAAHGGAAHVGGHGGGFHGGAAHVGGRGGVAHVGGYRGVAHANGYRGYTGRGIYNRGYYDRGYVGNRYYGRGYYGGYSGWPVGWLGSLAYPYYSGAYYDYDNGYPDYSDDYYPGDTTIYNAYPSTSNYYNPDVTPTYQTPAADLTATITVHVPPAAQVWFDGTPTTQTGEYREFASPPLTPGQVFHYDIRAQWNDGGRIVDQTRRVNVRAGGLTNVDFLQPAP